MRDNGSMSAATAALILFLGCANQAPPPGGPPDRVPPRVVSTLPAAQDVGVAEDVSIEITFSEPMHRRSVERSVFVTPRHASEPRLKWKGRRLIIDVSPSLRSNRTYRVSIGAESADEERNRMTASHDFAFSTGNRISRGEIGGAVRSGEGHAVYVWAFDLGDRDPDPGRDEPSYVTQIGTDGTFRFPGLGAGRYRVFAFTDVDRDRTYTPELDGLGIAPATVELVSDTSRVLLGGIRPVVRDTTGPLVVSASTRDRTHVRIRWDEAVAEPGTTSVTGLDVRATTFDPEDATVMWVATSPQTEGEVYRIAVVGARDSTGNIGVESSVEVKGDGRPDTRDPGVSTIDPADGAVVSPDVVLRIVFDEAMGESLPSPLFQEVEVDEGSAEPEVRAEVPSGVARWRRPNELVYQSTEPWAEGDYGLELGAGIADLAGNAVKVPPRFRFRVTGRSEEGSLFGRLRATTYPTVVRGRSLDTSSERRVRVAARDSVFVIERLQAGRYAIDAFGDLDEDSVWDAGTVSPFQPAEPVTAGVDTVEVPARWESALERVLRTVVQEAGGPDG